MLTQFKQQRERSGPGYDRMVERSRIMHEAWRAAGRPAKLQRTLIRSGDNWGEKWFVTSAWRRGENLEATPEQVQSWQQWRHAQRRIRREMGWDR